MQKTFEETNESGRRSGGKPDAPPALENSVANGRSNDSKGDSGRTGKDRQDSGGSVKYQPSRDAIAAKYQSKRDPKNRAEPISGSHGKPQSNPSSQHDVLRDSNGKDHFQAAASSGARWDSIKPNLPTFAAHRFAPLRQEKDSNKPQPSSSDSLDSIFQGLRSKREPSEYDDDNMDVRLLG